MAENINGGIGSYHLAERPDLYEIQRGNNFEFTVEGLNKTLRAGINPEAQPTDDDYIASNAEDVLKFSVVSFTEPHFSQSPIEIRRGNSVFKVAGTPTFDKGSLVINDYIGADGKSILMAWQNLSYNVATEKVGYMKDYKKRCYLREYTPAYKLVRTWTLEGCWVSGIQGGDFNAESNDKKTITATIEYDKAYMEYEYTNN